MVASKSACKNKRKEGVLMTTAKAIKLMKFLVAILFIFNFNSAYSIELIDAAKKGDFELVQALLLSGADVNERDNHGDSPLIFAAENNHKEIVELLLEKGADHTLQNNWSETALMVAAFKNNKEIVDILYSASKFTTPKKSCFLTFEQNDSNNAVTRTLISAILTKILSISSSSLLNNLFSTHQFMVEYFTSGKFTLLTDENIDLVIIIPESLTNLNIIIPDSLKQKELIPDSILVDVVRIEKKYGFKNLNLINPYFIAPVIKKYGEKIDSDQFNWLIDCLESSIDANNENHPTRFYLEGHGRPGSISAIPIDIFNNFLLKLSAIGTEFIYLVSCYTAGTNLLRIQSSLTNIITKQIEEKELLKQAYKQKLREYEWLMEQRMTSEPEKFPTPEIYRTSYPEPRQTYFPGIDYAIVIQATSDVPTRGTGNINAMLTKLDTFLQEPVWALKVGSGAEKPKITITDVISATGLNRADSLPSIRLPGKSSFFRSINIGKTEIINESTLIKKGVKRTLELIAKSKSPDKTVAAEAQKTLKGNLGIEIIIKPDIQFIQIFPIDLTDFTLIIQGAAVFISKLTGKGQHFIGKIIIDTNYKDINELINHRFFDIFHTKQGYYQDRCWFIKFVDAQINGIKTHIKKLVIHLYASYTKKRTYEYACINEKGEYMIYNQKEKSTEEEIEFSTEASESLIDKAEYESEVYSWFRSTIPTQATLTEATGGVEVTAEEKARLEREKGGAQALRLIEPRFARTSQDLFTIFLAD